jgi:hypothetical protein
VSLDEQLSMAASPRIQSTQHVWRAQSCVCVRQPRAQQAVQPHHGGSETLRMGRACRRNRRVEVSLLRLMDPGAGAPLLSRGALAAGPGELRRHRAA